jgi:hypothetical protein
MKRKRYSDKLKSKVALAVLRFVKNNEQLNAKRTRYESLGVCDFSDKDFN